MATAGSLEGPEKGSGRMGRAASPEKDIGHPVLLQTGPGTRADSVPGLMLGVGDSALVSPRGVSTLAELRDHRETGKQPG